MIPRSTTLTGQGRQIRQRAIWGVAVLFVLVLLAVAFAMLDRSTVVDGATGSSFVTTATGLAALHDTLERAGRHPSRIQQPLSPAAMESLDAYLVSDVEFAQYAEIEMSALAGFVEAGGRILVLGVPPRALVDAFDIDLAWSGTPVGVVAVSVPLEHTSTLDASRFGSFARDHGGASLAGSPTADLVVRFTRGEGEIMFIADSSLAHNTTVGNADNIDLFGDLLTGRIGFDEYRHGYDDTPATGLISAAPGNWFGAGVLGVFVLALALVSYGRRFGTIEPQGRELVPERSTFIDSVARSMRRAGGSLPVVPLRKALQRELGLAADATTGDLRAAARARGVPADILIGIESASATEQLHALDRTLATLFTRRGTHS
ncbi:MAG TPA: DUF4350 domain-containing protein [Acidimicrobiia bacterium]|nr:DUF4350 domain-containing protein [Acidimicrobiia bacterium]